MLEFICEYALSKLSNEQRASVKLLRAEYFRNKMQMLKQSASREDQKEYFQINFNNFYGALNWAISERQVELGFRLASELGDMWETLGYFKEGLDLLGQLLALPPEFDPAMRASVLQIASDLAWQQYDFETAITYSTQVVNLGRQLNLKEKYAAYINRLGRIYIEQGRYEEAKAVLNEALELAYCEPENLNPSVVLAQLGEVELFIGNTVTARQFFESALTHLTEEDGIFLAIAETDLAEIELLQGKYEQAHQWLVTALEPSSQHIRRSIVFFSALAGYLVLSLDGDKTKAAQFYGAIDSLSEQSGVILGMHYQNLNRERMRIARDMLSEKEWLDAYETGCGWERGETIQKAKDILSVRI